MKNRDKSGPPYMVPNFAEQLAHAICSGQSYPPKQPPAPEEWAGAAYLSAPVYADGLKRMTIKLRSGEHCLVYEVEDPEQWICMAVKLLSKIKEHNGQMQVMSGQTGGHR